MRSKRYNYSKNIVHLCRQFFEDNNDQSWIKRWMLHYLSLFIAGSLEFPLVFKYEEYPQQQSQQWAMGDIKDKYLESFLNKILHKKTRPEKRLKIQPGNNNM